MPKSQFYVALLKNVGSYWTPPVRPPNTPPPEIVKYDPEMTLGSGVFELAQVIGGLARDVMEDVHHSRTEDLATQVGALFPIGTSLILVPDVPSAVGWKLSPSYSLYTPGAEFWGDIEMEKITVNGSRVTNVVPGTSIPTFDPFPGVSIPGKFVVDTVDGASVIVNIPSFTAVNLESRGVIIRDMDIQQSKELPADARYDAHDHESQRDFDVGRDPSGADHFRDYQGDIRPGREIA